MGCNDLGDGPNHDAVYGVFTASLIVVLHTISVNIPWDSESLVLVTVTWLVMDTVDRENNLLQ